MITAPFNFVPLNEKVFYPSWAEQVSHDVPFEDGESGVIDVSMTARSPIFVRDGSHEEEFCNHNGEYYIPSSSVKGMVRNVLEIMSFSKMSQGSFNDSTYSVRDLSDSTNFYMSEMKKPTNCGWLKKIGNDFVVEDCGLPGRVKHEEIDKVFNMDFASSFKKGKFGNKADDKRALKKYKMIKSDNFTHNFKYLKSSQTGDKIYTYDKNSSTKGTIVLTGQPSGRDESRKIPSGKVYEFIFFDSKKEISLDKKTMDNFLFAYFDKRSTEPKESPDWTYWKKKIEKGEKIPVFFQKSGANIAHFGLSYLYKLPYKYSVEHGIPTSHKDSTDLDLTQTILGYTNKTSALKGRVQFSHFKADANAKELEIRKEILGTPRASYYPMYVKQHKGHLFTTFMDSGFNLSGRKRYPIHNGNKITKTEDTGNENVGTSFRPLKDGVVFSGKLRYHNLKKAELGAILSALTFHNTPNTYHHIGMAKSLGYGKISIKLSATEDITSYLKEFELVLTEQILNWKDSVQLKELIAMATEQNNEGDSKLSYMKLADFTKYKGRDNQDYLKCYTELRNIKSIAVKSLISEDDQIELEERNKKFEENRKKQEEQRKLQDEENEMFKLIQSTDNIAQITSFISKYPNTKHLSEANKLSEKIEQKEEQAKINAKQAVADEKWNAVQKVEPKYKQKALKDFISNYPDSTHISEAQKELESFGKSPQKNSLSDASELATVKNGKQFKSKLTKLDTVKYRDKILKYAVELCKKDLSKVDKTIKDANLKKFFDQAFIDEIKSLLGK